MKPIDATTRINLNNILFTTDFSDVSGTALLFAENIARRYGSKLFATHVIVPSETATLPPAASDACQQAIEEDVRRQMYQLGEQLRGFPHELLTRHGYIRDVVSALIEEKSIDLLVMGTHGRKRLDRLLMGSVAEQIFRQAACPVLTIGPQVPATTMLKAEFKTILFATDLSRERQTAAAYAISLAQDLHASLALVHAVTQHPGPFVDPEMVVLDHLRDLHELVTQDVESSCKPKYFVDFGDPAEFILQTAREQNADLIVLGVRSVSRPAGATTHLAISIAHTVVSRSTCPVLTLRG